MSRKRSIFLYGGVTGALGCLAFAYWFFVWKDIAYTDDAYVQGNLVQITPLHSGFVKNILRDDTFLAKKGELLVELDDTDAKIAFEAAKENLALKVREVCQAIHLVFSLDAEIKARQAEYIRAGQDYEHRLYVLNEGGVSKEEFEHAQAALQSTFFLLETTKALFARALAFVQGASILRHPEVVQAADRVRQTFVDLYRCKIYAPVEGLVAQRSIQVGMWVEAGHPLMTLIPLDQIWVNVNFKETQMKRMRIGQRVDLTSDLYGREVHFQGAIAGLPGGAGNVFSLLPPQNLSGNWIKIVQRLPVRVHLCASELKAHPLRLGLSMEARVNLKEEGPLLPLTGDLSPRYTTDIFLEEEQGDEQVIQEVIETNMDPLLREYGKKIFTWSS